MIATITLNPSLDEDIFVNGLVLDEANRWVKLRHYAGGKGTNVSRAIHEMGGLTVAYGFIGGPVGRAVEILLDEEGVPFSFTPIAQETRTNVIITDTKTFQQTRIDAPGPHISKRELERFLKKLRQILPNPVLQVVGGSVPPGVPVSIYYDIIMEAKDRGIRTILDAEGQWLEEGIKAKPIDRWMDDLTNTPIKRVSAQEIDLAFYISLKRKVKNDSTISVNSVLYEAPPGFIGKVIELRHPSDKPQELTIYENDKAVYKVKEVKPYENANLPGWEIKFDQKEGR